MTAVTSRSAGAGHGAAPRPARAAEAPAAVSRRDRIRAATSLEIRQAARRILVRHGPPALTLRAVAREVGMTAPALYRYFSSREDLVTHLAADIFLEVTDDVRAAIKTAGHASHGDAAATLAAARQAFRRWSLQHRAEFGLAFAAPLPRVGQDDRAAECGQQFASAFLELFLQRWQEGPIPAPPELIPAEAAGPLDYLSGWLRADLPADTVHAFLRCWIRLHTAVTLEVSGYPGMVPEESGAIQAENARPLPGPARSRLAEADPARPSEDTQAIAAPAFDAAGRTSAAAASTRRRRTADERRAQVLEAAIHEFARHGLHQATTAAIAARANISEPYLFALFRGKKDLFLAAQDRARDDIQAALVATWRTAAPKEPLAIALRRCHGLLTHPDSPRCRLQGFAAAPADPEIQDHMRSGCLDSFNLIQGRTGADTASVARFIAMSLLLNLASELDLPGLDSMGAA